MGNFQKDSFKGSYVSFCSSLLIMDADMMEDLGQIEMF